MKSAIRVVASFRMHQSSYYQPSFIRPKTQPASLSHPQVDFHWF